MYLSNEHSLRALSMHRARTRALYMLFVVVLTSLVLTIIALLGALTPQAYASETSNPQVNTQCDRGLTPDTYPPAPATQNKT